MGHILPENYPTGCNDEIIIKTIDDLQKEIKTESVYNHTIAYDKVMRDGALIQLGQNELAGRFNKKYILLSLAISAVSLILSFLAIKIAIDANTDSTDWKERQLQILESIHKDDQSLKNYLLKK